MNRPKITVEKSLADSIIEIITFLSILGSVVLIVAYYNQLPEKLPIYFNWPSKDKDGFGAKDLLWASPVICGIIVIGIHMLNKFPQIFNYPVTINEENAAYNYKLVTQMLRILNLLIGLLCLAITLLSILSALDIETNLLYYFVMLSPALLIGLPFFYVIKMVRKKTI